MQRCQKIVRDSAREFRDNVRRRGSDQKQIRSLRHSDMFDRAFKIRFAAGFGEQVGDHFLSGERGKGERRYELAGRARHYNLNRKSILLETAHQLRGLYAATPPVTPSVMRMR